MSSFGFDTQTQTFAETFSNGSQVWRIHLLSLPNKRMLQNFQIYLRIFTSPCFQHRPQIIIQGVEVTRVWTPFLHGHWSYVDFARREGTESWCNVQTPFSKWFWVQKCSTLWKISFTYTSLLTSESTGMREVCLLYKFFSTDF